MNRDALLASGIGFGIGLLITAVILVGPNLLQKIKSKNILSMTTTSVPAQPKGQTTPTPKVDNVNTFSVDTPESEAIIASDSVKISGKAPAKSIILFGGALDETAVQASDTGTFEATISLKEGVNTVSVVNLKENAQEVKTLTLYSEP